MVSLNPYSSKFEPLYSIVVYPNRCTTGIEELRSVLTVRFGLSTDYVQQGIQGGELIIRSNIPKFESELLQKELENFNIPSTLQKDHTQPKRNLIQVDEEHSHSLQKDELFKFIPLNSNTEDIFNNANNNHDTNNKKTNKLCTLIESSVDETTQPQTSLMSGWGDIFPNFTTIEPIIEKQLNSQLLEKTKEKPGQRKIILPYQTPIVPTRSETDNPIDLAVNYLQNQTQEKDSPHHRQKFNKLDRSSDTKHLKTKLRKENSNTQNKKPHTRILLIILAGFVLITSTTILSIIYFGKDPNIEFKSNSLYQTTENRKTTKRQTEATDVVRETQVVDIREANHTLKSNPRKEARKLFSEGKAACATGNYGYCRDIMREVIALDPKHPEAYKLLVIATEKLNNITPEPQ